MPHALVPADLPWSEYSVFESVRGPHPAALRRHHQHCDPTRGALGLSTGAGHRALEQDPKPEVPVHARLLQRLAESPLNTSAGRQDFTRLPRRSPRCYLPTAQRHRLAPHLTRPPTSPASPTSLDTLRWKQAATILTQHSPHIMWGQFRTPLWYLSPAHHAHGVPGRGNTAALQGPPEGLW
ncbi:Hypothetical predicted protein [Marmota monax]|uniref:Uncharacterized protein n=1 Tax=Marmota monax TaxID=9995 RepID=A0A5E4AEU4_MARMO|nr:Hypothetical predicted protein [Marmota monax]